jgi:drug/metabolite transporter (DMT)-like permease
MGILFAIAAAIGYGLGNVFARLGMQYVKVQNGTLISLFFSMVLVILVALVVEPENLFSVSLIAVLWFSIAGIINFPIGRYLSYMGTARLGAARSATIRASQSLWILVLAVSFLSEALTISILIGTLLVVVGLYLIMSEE